MMFYQNSYKESFLLTLPSFNFLQHAIKIEKNIPEYVAKLNEMSYNQFKAVLIFITDVIKQGSYVLYNDASKDLVEDSFGITDLYEGYFIQDLISRKKQSLPAI